MARLKLNDQNLLDLIPIQTVDWEMKPDGTVFLRKPKFKNSFLKKIITYIGKSSDYKIHLDEFGTYVWKRCDGIHKLQQIGESLRQEFGERIEPVYERLGAFIKILASQKCITYKDISNFNG